MPLQALCIIWNPSMNWNWSYSHETHNSGLNWQFFVLCDLENRQMTWKTIRHFLLCYFKLCASFRNHVWIETGVTVRKCPNWCKICFDLCDLELWPLTLAFCMDITFVNGNHSWKFPEDGMTGTLWKRCNRRTDGQTDRQTEPLLELFGCSYRCYRVRCHHNPHP